MLSGFCLPERRRRREFGVGGRQGAADVRDPPQRDGLGRPGGQPEGQQVQRDRGGPGHLYQVHHPRRGCV